MKTKTSTLLCILAIFGAVSILSNGCSKKDDSNNNPPETQVTDKDGNVYHTITIGTQVWMVENLKTTKFNDGSAIPIVADKSEWFNLITPGMCWYDNDANNKSPYGALYNWHTINTGKLAPTGWRIATSSDWNVLISALGGDQVAGGKLKTGTGWDDGSGSNSSGFTAYPSGDRNSMTSDPLGFGDMGHWAYFWLPSEKTSENAYMVELYAGYDKIWYDGWNPKKNGCSIRCIKN